MACRSPSWGIHRNFTELFSNLEMLQANALLGCVGVKCSGIAMNGVTVLAMPKRFSTVRGREFGDGLRAAIAATGMTSRKVAELVDWQEAKLSDLVNGKGGATELELALLLGACRTPPRERDHLLSLFTGTGV